MATITVSYYFLRLALLAMCVFLQPLPATPTVTVRAGSSLRVAMLHRHHHHHNLGLHFTTRRDAIRDLLTTDANRLAARANRDGHRRGLAALSTPLTSAASRGAALYYVQLNVGTPAQKVTFIPDTGSDLIWAHCQGRSGAKLRFSNFSPAKSRSLTYEPCRSATCSYFTGGQSCMATPARTCGWQASYLQGAKAGGPLLNETLAGARVTMGCSRTVQGFSVEAGVLALGQGAISFAAQTLGVYGGVFAYCLGDYLRRRADKSSLMFGSAATSGTRGMMFTPMKYNGRMPWGYYVNVVGISVGSELVPITRGALSLKANGQGGTIIDSGTSLTYLEPNTYAKVMAVLNKHIRYPIAKTRDPAGFHRCFNIGRDKYVKGPSISLVFDGGARLVAPPANWAVSIGRTIRCVGIKPLRSNGGQSIIGALLHQNWLVQYDLLNQRIGFLSKDC